MATKEISTKKKKLNSRGKKVVRRTIAGLMMASALIVAAIPEDSSGQASAHSQVADPLDYTADSSEARNGDLTGQDQSGHTITFLTPPSDPDELKYSYQVITVDGNWQLLWKYQYYNATMDSNYAGVVSDYNDNMRINQLDLSSQTISGYEYVTLEEYNSYVTNNINTLSFTLDIRPDTNGSDGSDYTFVQRYFPEKYEEFVSQYNTALSTYRLAIDNPSWYPQNPSDFLLLQINPLHVTGESMNDNDKRIFYCNSHKNRGDGTISLSGCTLVKVSNLCISTGDTVFNSFNGKTYEQLPSDTEIFIVSRNDSTASGDNFDENGFMYNGSSTIKAIANKAFYNTKLVDTISIGAGITYVGDEAFQNSFIKSVNFVSVTYIGNRVFEDCDSLTDVDLGSYTTTIGKEAFHGCDALSEIIVPKDVDAIGFGAFANCPVLSTVDFSGNQGCNVSDYAFYDCPYLSSVTFPNDYQIGLGKAVFALTEGSGSTASLSNFSFPAKLGQYESPVNGEQPLVYNYDSDSSFTCKMGDFMLANRYNLSSVTMPTDFGTSSTVETVPVRTFHGSPDLGVLYFGKNANSNAEFEPQLFEDVTNPDLYVFGPQNTTTKGSDGEFYALPRRSTWEASSAVADYVPYVYNDGTNDHYEVGVNGFRYELSVDNPTKTAEMIRCEFIDPSAATVQPLTVPGSVAGYSIKSMANGCFDNVKDYISVLTIADNSVETIDTGVFSDCDNLERVVLGNSVKTLGNQAFASNPKLEWVEVGENIELVGDECFLNCPKLYTVDWDTPSDYGKLKSIGPNAFYTGNPDGTVFYGDIVSGYLPFEYAMSNNRINSSSMSLCYKSTIPSNYTECTYGYATDAPGTSYPVLEQYTVIKDEATGLRTLIDYPRYSDLDPTIKSKYAANQSLNDSETNQLNATLYMNVPAAVESIDVLAFKDSSASNPNKKNWGYLPQDSIDEANSNKKSDVYGDSYITGIGGQNVTTKYANDGGYTAGLFSGEMSDTTELIAQTGSSSDEKLAKGNDWILSVDLPGVKYIPDHCFDSCERLQSVIIGSGCNEIGESAFQGCDALNSIGTNNNPKYAFDNFILYEKNSDGTYKLNTCLPARGKVSDSKQIWVNTDNDPMLKNTSDINEGAFASCKYISKVDLSDTTLSAIPQRCFDDCDKLTDVILPDTIKSIAKQAFNTDSGTLDIKIPCNANISDEAFNKNDIVTIYTYRKCDITGNYDPVGYDKIFIKYIDDLETFKITYLYDDLSVYEVVEVVSGYNGYYPDKNPSPKLPENKNKTFSYWSFDNANGIKKVTENRQAIAVFAGSASGNTPSPSPTTKPTSSGSTSPSPSSSATSSASNNNSGSTAKTYNVTVENGAGSGKYEPGKVVTITAYAPADGKVFDKWTTSNTDIGFANATSTSTTFIMPTHDVKVTATFKTAGSSTSNNSANTNGNTNGNTNTNTGGNTNTNNGTTNNTGNRNNTGTQVDVTSDTIDNNKKNLASASVAGSTDNFVVKITDSAQASAQVEQALKQRYGNDLSAIKYIAFDISLYDSTGTNHIANSDNLAVTITLPIPDDLVTYAGNNKVGAVINGQLDEKAVKFTTIDGVPCMTFTATHFSPYTIFVDTNHLLQGNVDLTPKTGIDIAPKWFLAAALGLFSIVLFLWKDKKKIRNLA